MRLTLGKASAGISLGRRGLHAGWNTRRGAYASTGLPGSGLYAMTYLNRGGSHVISHNYSGVFVASFVFVGTVLVVFALAHAIFTSR